MIDGSPVLACKASRECDAPLTEIHLADADPTVLAAAEVGVAAAGCRPNIHPGRAEDVAASLAKSLNPYGLLFAFLDPFDLRSLHFAILT